MMWTAKRGGRQSSQAATVALEQHCYISNNKKTILQILHPVLCLIIGLDLLGILEDKCLNLTGGPGTSSAAMF